MGLRILHAADLHLGSRFGSLPSEQRERLRLVQRRLPEQLAAICIREQCDLVLLAGDLFDCPPGRDTVDALKQALARCRVPVCIAPGNHDFWGADFPWEESWPENVHIFKGGISALDLHALDCRVYGAGYLSMDCPALLEDFHADGDLRYRIGVLHGDPLTLSSPCCPVTAAQVRESGLDYLALGHIHRSGSFRVGGTVCAWPGCAMGRGWDETGPKGVCLVNLDEEVRVQQILLDVPRFQELRSDLSEAPLDTLLDPARYGDLYRITLTGTCQPDLAELREQYSYLGYLELVDETFPESDPWECSGDDSLRGVFYALLQQKLNAAPPEQAEVIRLAAELSAKLLDGREVELP